MATRRRRGLTGVLLVAVVAWAGLACSPPAAVPAVSGDPANGVTIDNGTDTTVTILYEAPDETTEPLADLAPGGHIVIDGIFAGRDGLCRTGRLVAQTADGTEIDELYLVCRDRTWTIEAS